MKMPKLYRMDAMGTKETELQASPAVTHFDDGTIGIRFHFYENDTTSLHAFTVQLSKEEALIVASRIASEVAHYL